MLGILTVLIELTVTLYLVQRQFIYFPTKQDLPQAEREARLSKFANSGPILMSRFMD